MNANDYQKLASRTLIAKPDFDITDKKVMLSWWALGLSGEAGEVADLIKKGIYHQQGIDELKLKKELGDVLWYIAALCTEMGFTMEEVMQQNVEKLKARFPDGYSPERTTFKEGNAE
ncbi:MAG: nucleoside triphosphate pyrophosphohydrolase family protein [Saprospiraceae bacterium]